MGLGRTAAFVGVVFAVLIAAKREYDRWRWKRMRYDKLDDDLEKR